MKRCSDLKPKQYYEPAPMPQSIPPPGRVVVSPVPLPRDPRIDGRSYDWFRNTWNFVGEGPYNPSLVNAPRPLGVGSAPVGYHYNRIFEHPASAPSYSRREAQWEKYYWHGPNGEKWPIYKRTPTGFIGQFHADNDEIAFRESMSDTILQRMNRKTRYSLY